MFDAGSKGDGGPNQYVGRYCNHKMVIPKIPDGWRPNDAGLFLHTAPERKPCFLKTGTSIFYMQGKPVEMRVTIPFYRVEICGKVREEKKGAMNIRTITADCGVPWSMLEKNGSDISVAHIRGHGNYYTLICVGLKAAAEKIVEALNARGMVCEKVMSRGRIKVWTKTVPDERLAKAIAVSSLLPASFLHEKIKNGGGSIKIG